MFKVFSLRKLISVITVFLLLAGWLRVEPAWAAATPVIQATSAVLIDSATGRVLYEKNAHERRAQASTTKITTSILALEQGKLDREVKISAQAAQTGESSVELKKGEVLTLRQLLYALMLHSGNDAAVAIAQEVGGTVSNFVQMMNAKAEAIGAKDTHYTSPHGLDDPEHYSSAYDLALLARYGIRQVPGFQQLVATKTQEIPGTWHQGQPRMMVNRNELLGSYPGADGVKTGWTNRAGKCLVASATRNGQQYIAVVMDSPDYFGEAASLLDYGFNNYQYHQVVGPQTKVRTIPVNKGKETSVSIVGQRPFKVLMAQNGQDHLNTQVELPKVLEAPVRKGQVVGKCTVYLNDQAMGEMPLIAQTAVEKQNKWILLWNQLLSWLKRLI